MLTFEFITLTNYCPTPEEWKNITSEYMNSDIDKFTFCENWKKEHADLIKRYRDKKAAEERFGNLCDKFVDLMYKTTNRRSKKYVSENDEVKYFSNFKNVQEIAKTLNCSLKELKKVAGTCKKFKTLSNNVLYRIAIIFTEIL